MLAWMRANKVLMAWLGVASVVMLLMGLVLVPLLITRMPADYFLHPEPHAGSWRDRHPAVRFLLHVGKNALGIVFVLGGIAMLILPGQGILTILVGIAFLDLPGKRRFELALIRWPPVKRGIGWLRAKAGSPPLELPPSEPR